MALCPVGFIHAFCFRGIKCSVNCFIEQGSVCYDNDMHPRSKLLGALSLETDPNTRILYLDDDNVHAWGYNAIRTEQQCVARTLCCSRIIIIVL